MLAANHRHSSAGAVCSLGGLCQFYVASDAPAPGRLRPGDEAYALGSVSGCSFRNLVDARPRGKLKYWRSCSRFFTRHARQVIQRAFVGTECETTRRDDLWQLHLTTFPAGGSRSQQTLRSVRATGCLSRGVYHRSAPKRYLADAEQYQGQSYFCYSEE